MKTPVFIVALLALAATSCFAATAQENWNKSCKLCHGADGSGKTNVGKKLGLLDYTKAEDQAKFTDEEATKVILDGKEKMKPFKEKLTAEEVEDLVKLVRSFGPK